MMYFVTCTVVNLCQRSFILTPLSEDIANDYVLVKCEADVHASLYSLNNFTDKYMLGHYLRFVKICIVLQVYFILYYVN